MCDDKLMNGPDKLMIQKSKNQARHQKLLSKSTNREGEFILLPPWVKTCGDITTGFRCFGKVLSKGGWTIVFGVKTVLWSARQVVVFEF